MKAFYTLLILFIPFAGIGQINENNIRTDTPFRIQKIEIVEEYDPVTGEIVTFSKPIDSINYRILESYIDTVKNNPLAFKERAKYKLDKLTNYGWLINIDDFENINLTDTEYANIKEDLFLSIKLQESFENNSLIGSLFLISKDYTNARKYYSKAIKFDESHKRVWTSKPYINQSIFLFSYFKPFLLWEKTSQKRKIKNYYLHQLNSIKDSIDFFKEVHTIEYVDNETKDLVQHKEFYSNNLNVIIWNLSREDNNHRVILKEYVEFCVKNNLELVSEDDYFFSQDEEFLEVFKNVKLELEYKKEKPWENNNVGIGQINIDNVRTDSILELSDGGVIIGEIYKNLRTDSILELRDGELTYMLATHPLKEDATGNPFNLSQNKFKQPLENILFESDNGIVKYDKENEILFYFPKKSGRATIYAHHNESLIDSFFVWVLDVPLPKVKLYLNDTSVKKLKAEDFKNAEFKVHIDNSPKWLTDYLNYQIKGYKLSISLDGMMKTMVTINERFTSEMIDRIKDAPIGTKLYFEDIISTEPSGRKINLGAIIITID